MRSSTPASSFIYLTVLLDAMAIGLVAPALPQLLGSMLGDPSHTAWGYGALQMGFAFMQLFAAPALGGLSDQVGRRPVLLLGMASMTLTFLAGALATQFWVLLLFRTLSGAATANMAVTSAYIADVTPAEDKAGQYGRLGAMFGIGFVAGPVVGGLLADHNLRWPFYAAAVLALLNTLYGWAILPESLPAERRRAFKWQAPWHALLALKRLQGMAPLLWVLAAVMLVQAAFETFWLLYTSFKFGWSAGDNGLSLLAIAVAAALSQALLLKPLQQWLSAPRLIVLGQVSFMACLMAWGLAYKGWMMYAVAAANVLGYVIYPCAQSLVSGKVEPDKQGETMGTLSAMASVMAVLGPALATPLMALSGGLPASDWRTGAPFFATALIMLAALVNSAPALLRKNEAR